MGEEDEAQRARVLESLQRLPKIRDARGLWLDEGDVVDGQRVVPPELVAMPKVAAAIHIPRDL